MRRSFVLLLSGGRAMKRVAVVAGVAFLLAGVAASGSAQNYSNASVKGSYKCNGHGQITLGMTEDMIFQLIADGNGNYTGGELVNHVAGQICHYTLAKGSTYTVQAGGTGQGVYNWTGASDNPFLCPLNCTSRSTFDVCPSGPRACGWVETSNNCFRETLRGSCTHQE